MMKKAVFRLEPLTCPSCVKRIEKTIGNLKGVEEVTVLFHSSRVRVQMDESIINTDQIENKIVKLGFPVVSVQVS